MLRGIDVHTPPTATYLNPAILRTVIAFCAARSIHSFYVKHYYQNGESEHYFSHRLLVRPEGKLLVIFHKKLFYINIRLSQSTIVD